MRNQVILFYSFLRPVAVIPDFSLTITIFQNLTSIKHFIIYISKKYQVGFRAKTYIKMKSGNFFSGFLRNCIYCVHNCEDHSSFDFISAVLIYDLSHIPLPKHDIFTCENNMLSSRRAFRCES